MNVLVAKLHRPFEFQSHKGIQETAVRVFRRYLQLFPDNAEQYVEYLISIGRLDEAAVLLAKLVNDSDFVSKRGKSNHTMWHELCQLISKNPHKVRSLNVDAIIRGGLRRYTDQVSLELNSSSLVSKHITNFHSRPFV